MKAPRANILKCYALSFTWGFIILSPIMVPFFQSKNLTMSEVFMIQAAFGVTLGVLDIPSGYFSDLFGRKAALIIAALLRGLGATALVLAEGFYGSLAAYMLIGAANSFLSGSDIALLYESHEKVQGDKPTVAALRGRTYFLGYLSITAAALVGGYLGGISLETAAIANAVMAWMALPIVLMIEETGAKQASRTEHWKNLSRVYRNLFLDSRILRTLIIVTVMYNFALSTSAWTLQARWEDFSFTLVYFGYISAVQSISSAFAGIYAGSALPRLGWRMTLTFLGVLPIAAFFGTSLPIAAVAVGSALLFELIRPLVMVVLIDEINQRIVPEYRATANSVLSFCNRILFFLCGPLMGYLMQHYGTATVLRLFAGFYVVVFFGLLIPAIRQREAGEQEAPALPNAANA